MTWAWIWIACLLLGITTEILFKRSVSIWFLPALIIAILLDIIKIGIIYQSISFILIAIPSFILLRKYIIMLPINYTKIDIDSVVGKRCIVTEKIDTYAGCGQVDVKGTRWSARGLSEEDEFNVGDTLTVVAVEGVKLVCKRD